MSRATRALIDLAALQHNLAVAARQAPGARVMAVVKANAYGHGLITVARALHDADAFGVACLEEGIALRGAGVHQPVVLLEGVQEAADLEAVRQHRLEVVVHQAEQAAQLEALGAGAPIKVWIKVDTGMHRLGFEPEALPAVFARLRAAAAVHPDIHLMTHLACADDRSDPRTAEQLQRFQRCVAELPGPRSIANSGGVLAWPDCHADWVRPGIMLYGASPFLQGSGAELGLRPVMTLSSRLIAVNRFARGDAIGYGGTWRCPEDMPVGVVAIGYGDGYPRHAPSGTPVLVNGRRVPLIGRVSMDMICVDLRSQPQARVGDPVVLWGQGLAVEEVAARAGTIAYELLCGVTTRVRAECLQPVGAPGQAPRQSASAE